MANFFLDNKDLQYHLEHPLMKKIIELKENNFENTDNELAPVSVDDAMDNYRKVLEIIGEIAGNTIAPNAESVDAEGPQVVDNHVVYARGTQENHDTLTQAGVYGLSLPREYGGLNFSMVPYVMSCEIVSRADAGFGNIWGLQDCAETLHEFASDEQNARFLPRIQYGETCAMDLTEPDAGSDLQAVMLKAHYDEERGTWLLNGVKRFITNGDAHISLVLARSEEGTADARGLSLFVYDKIHDAVKVRRIEHKLGIIGSPTCELVFTDAPCELVGDRKMGLIRYVMGLMNAARLGIGAQSTGISEAAYREGLQYAKERKQFGKAIIEFPAVYEMLTNMNAKVLSSRAMLYETTRFVDLYKLFYHISKSRKLTKEERAEMKLYNKLADGCTPLLKLMASEYCNEVSYDSLQIHAGSGYMKDYPIQRIARDARITNIYEGTTQLQVVAAIKAVTTGSYAQLMEQYEAVEVLPEFASLVDKLKLMRADYLEAVSIVTTINDESSTSTFLDFHARRLVEMAGHIILGHLLIQQASSDFCKEDREYAVAASAYVKMGMAKSAGHFVYIKENNADAISIFSEVIK